MRPLRELVSIGEVVKAQGRRGEVLVRPLSDHPGRFAALRRVYVAAAPGECREAAVTGCWPHKGRFVLKLEGVDSIEAAQSLRGSPVCVGEEELPRLPAGSFYHHELRGLEVFDERGRGLGSVADLVETGAAPVLVVRGPLGELLIPLAAPFIREVVPEAGRMVVAVPEPEAQGGRPRPPAA